MYQKMAKFYLLKLRLFPKKNKGNFQYQLKEQEF